MLATFQRPMQFAPAFSCERGVFGYTMFCFVRDQSGIASPIATE